jgi:hypothetical protein
MREKHSGHGGSACISISTQFTMLTVNEQNLLTAEPRWSCSFLLCAHVIENYRQELLKTSG